MLAGSSDRCPSMPCLASGVTMTDIVYLENVTHLTLAISASETLCNAGHNGDGGFGDGKEPDRSCYECYSVPSPPVLSAHGDYDLDTTIVVCICEEESYQEGTSTYASSGTYEVLYQSSEGCDSTVTTLLTVNGHEPTENTVTICHGETYTDGSPVYTETGVYTETYTTAAHSFICQLFSS